MLFLLLGMLFLSWIPTTAATTTKLLIIIKFRGNPEKIFGPHAGSLRQSFQQEPCKKRLSFLKMEPRTRIPTQVT